MRRGRSPAWGRKRRRGGDAFVAFNGRVAGISGIVGGLLARRADGRDWRLAFVAGLIVAPLMLRAAGIGAAPQVDASWPVVVAAGLLVGIGTRYAGGCTSGHGVCGQSRGSLRSLVATATFMAVGFLIVFVQRHVLGG
ncbi:YeeE/YedE family protein [Burkholderia ubonensis]|uniref:YeeE/YedE family protein n=1 Tax=Burkholderia ubonensis TaxID=101571 RepID=UPI000752997C|nr:YeeE/YedE family protein [Burkholderia ubonensis]KVP48262.1 YeeE/YedE [Burkholderia ubonensis]KVQ85030.1 YeeE/YedE [Burkholderia ubonensis]KVR06940.1 YeeE/YedE [Burkholderia ubonensis]KWD40756.1 YeeE/YedE [Burkholderia ubonensis]KWD41594.1 YeeE/YedE [Burkholderia ubonensis]